VKPEEILARRLAAEIESELAALAALGEEFANTPKGDETYSVRARGSILHDFYNGVERVFLRIARELNGGVPATNRRFRSLDAWAMTRSCAKTDSHSPGEESGCQPACVRQTRSGNPR